MKFSFSGLKLLGQDPRVIEQATLYLRGSAFGLFFLILGETAFRFFVFRGQIRRLFPYQVFFHDKCTRDRVHLFDIYSSQHIIADVLESLEFSSDVLYSDFHWITLFHVIGTKLICPQCVCSGLHLIWAWLFTAHFELGTFGLGLANSFTWTLKFFVYYWKLYRLETSFVVEDASETSEEEDYLSDDEVGSEDEVEESRDKNHARISANETTTPPRGELKGIDETGFERGEDRGMAEDTTKNVNARPLEKTNGSHGSQRIIEKSAEILADDVSNMNELYVSDHKAISEIYINQGEREDTTGTNGWDPQKLGVPAQLGGSLPRRQRSAEAAYPLMKRQSSAATADGHRTSSLSKFEKRGMLYKRKSTGDLSKESKVSSGPLRRWGSAPFLKDLNGSFAGGREPDETEFLPLPGTSTSVPLILFDDLPSFSDLQTIEKSESTRRVSSSTSPHRRSFRRSKDRAESPLRRRSSKPVSIPKSPNDEESKSGLDTDPELINRREHSGMYSVSQTLVNAVQAMRSAVFDRKDTVELDGVVKRVSSSKRTPPEQNATRFAHDTAIPSISQTKIYASTPAVMESKTAISSGTAGVTTPTSDSRRPAHSTTGRKKKGRDSDSSVKKDSITDRHKHVSSSSNSKHRDSHTHFPSEFQSALNKAFHKFRQEGPGHETGDPLFMARSPLGSENLADGFLPDASNTTKTRKSVTVALKVHHNDEGRARRSSRVVSSHTTKSSMESPSSPPDPGDPNSVVSNRVSVSKSLSASPSKRVSHVRAPLALQYKELQRWRRSVVASNRNSLSNQNSDPAPGKTPNRKSRTSLVALFESEGGDEHETAGAPGIRTPHSRSGEAAPGHQRTHSGEGDDDEHFDASVPLYDRSISLQIMRPDDDHGNGVMNGPRFNRSLPAPGAYLLEPSSSRSEDDSVDVHFQMHRSKNDPEKKSSSDVTSIMPYSSTESKDEDIDSGPISQPLSSGESGAASENLGSRYPGYMGTLSAKKHLPNAKGGVVPDDQTSMSSSANEESSTVRNMMAMHSTSFVTADVNNLDENRPGHLFSIVESANSSHPSPLTPEGHARSLVPSLKAMGAEHDSTITPAFSQQPGQEPSLAFVQHEGMAKDIDDQGNANVVKQPLMKRGISFQPHESIQLPRNRSSESLIVSRRESDEHPEREDQLSKAGSSIYDGTIGIHMVRQTYSDYLQTLLPIQK